MELVTKIKQQNLIRLDHLNGEALARQCVEWVRLHKIEVDRALLQILTWSKTYK